MRDRDLNDLAFAPVIEIGDGLFLLGWYRLDLRDRGVELFRRENRVGILFTHRGTYLGQRATNPGF